MIKMIAVSALLLLITGCAARHAPWVSCSAKLEEINTPSSADVPRPTASTPNTSKP